MVGDVWFSCAVAIEEFLEVLFHLSDVYGLNVLQQLLLIL